ncbi:MAG TPA: cytochrome b N-terminal domain-containing protein [Gemmataceae bacterium]|nr:cytochrome b N-terminal domain-containing protein [Gemmataceae bacterium]
MQKASESPVATGFWGQRTGWTILKQVLFLEPLPGGSRWAAAFGSLLLFAFMLQVLTGILLAMNYSPSVESAWPSVKFIQSEPMGAFIRALHHWGSSAMVILLLAHLLQVFIWGAYKKPRELTWMVGVLLLVCTLGLAFTGYLLPWDQKAYWATKVGLGMISTVPGIGDDLRGLLQGGPQMGNLTLTRFFAIHTYVLPGLIIFLVVVHLYLFRLHGVTPPWWQSPQELQAQSEPFWPKQLLKDGIVWLIFLLALGLWCYYRAAPLENPADPSQPYEARPEWYFMFLFRLLRFFKGPYEVVGTFVLPLVFFLVLFFWPLLDRSPYRDPRRRPIAIGLLGLGTASLIGFTIYAIATDVRMTVPAQASVTPAEPADPVQRADVAKVYNANCASCHGVEGNGKQIRAAMPTIPDFTSLSWQKSQTNLEIVHRIQDGNEPLMPAYRDKLSEQQILALAIYVRAFEIGTAEASPATTPVKPKSVQPPTPAANMAPVQIYKAYCLACHDADGRGRIVGSALGTMPDFTDSKWQTGHSDSELKQSILNGKGKFMLPMKDKLSDADADKMVAYVRAFREGKQVVAVQPTLPIVPPPPAEPTVVPPSKPAAPPVTPPAAKPATTDSAARTRVATEMYRQYCLSCHGTDGRGNDLRAGMPAIPDFTRPAWQESRSVPQLIASILDGKGSLMPAFRGRVNEEQARDLAAYVRAFGPAAPTTEPPSTPSDADFQKRFDELQRQWSELQKQLQQPPPKP